MRVDICANLKGISLILHTHIPYIGVDVPFGGYEFRSDTKKRSLLLKYLGEL